MIATRSISEQSDTVSVLDMDAIQRIRDMEVDGQPSILQEVISLYLELAPQLLADACSGLAENDSKRVFSAAHQIKSMSGQVGAWHAAEAARVVEDLGRQGELAGIQNLMDKLEESLNRSCEALKAAR